MKPFTFSRAPCPIYHHSRLIISPRYPLLIRKSSTQTDPLTQASLYKTLTSRAPNIIHDYLSPTQSHLLNISLAGFLPSSCYAPRFQHSDLRLPGRYDEHFLPQGHHLVYFPPQVLSSDLLADGTDPLQSPGAPFNRRMWAGGSLLFNGQKKYQMELDGTRAVCIERITDVRIKGGEGGEKIFVEIERRIGHIGRKLHDRLHDAYDEEWAQRMEERCEDFLRMSNGHGNDEHGRADLGELGVVETRNLVFMREKSPAEAAADAAKAGKIVKPTQEPDFSVRITPTQQLLFRFSALTFNAHGIHLDPQYCREVEGYRNLLVHGPLSLALMLSVLRSQLKDGEMIVRFDYRNLAPLFTNEEMKISVRRDRERENRFDVWIEGGEGGYAAKGSAVVGERDAKVPDVDYLQDVE